MPWTLKEALWLGPVFIEAATAAVMFHRKIWRSFPVFWSYLLFETIRTCLLFAIGMEQPHYATYFYVFWITEGIASFFGFFIVREIFDRAFPKSLGLQNLGRTVFRGSILVLVIVAVYSASVAPGNDASKLVAGIFVVKRADSVLRVGLLAALFVFTFLFGLPWSNQLIGIAMGLAIYDAVELLGLAIRSHYGRGALEIYSGIRMGVNVFQKMIWAAYFILQGPTTLSRAPRISITGAELGKMNDAVDSVLSR